MSINPDWFAEVTRIWLVIWLKAVNIKRELHYLCPLMFLFRMVRTIECSTCFSSSFLMSTSSVYKGQKTVTTINKQSRKAGNDINCKIWKTQLSKMVPFHPDTYTSKLSLINLTLKMLETFALNGGYEIVSTFPLTRVTWLRLIGWMHKIVNKYYRNAAMLLFSREKRIKKRGTPVKPKVSDESN